MGSLAFLPVYTELNEDGSGRRTLYRFSNGYGAEVITMLSGELEGTSSITPMRWANGELRQSFTIPGFPEEVVVDDDPLPVLEELYLLPAEIPETLWVKAKKYLSSVKWKFWKK